MDNSNIRLNKLFKALFHIQIRPGMYIGVSDYKGIVDLITGISIGIHDDILMGNVEGDNHYWDVIQDFGFEHSPKAYWHQMEDDNKSSVEIIDSIIKVHVEVLRRRYDYSIEDIQRLRNDFGEEMNQRKIHSNAPRNRPKTKN